MAQRKVQRQKVVAPRGRAPVVAIPRAEPKTADGWRRECEQLRTELQAARDEIAALQSRQEQVLNRIEWVLDALDSLPESEP
jgi:hypothetical protein